MTGAYYGLWSGIELTKEIGFLVIAKGDSFSPSELMQEEFCKGLYSFEREVELQMAIAAEGLFQKVRKLKVFKYSELVAVQELFKFVVKKRKLVKDIFGRYFWVRVRPVFLNYWEKIFPDVLEIIQSDESTPDLRISLIYDLYESTLFLEPNEELFQKVIRAYLLLMLEKEAEFLHYKNAEVYLYNLIYRPEKNPPEIMSIIPDVEKREQLKKVVSQFPGNRAQKVLKWLSGS
jgi:hypothetical protein